MYQPLLDISRAVSSGNWPDRSNCSRLRLSNTETTEETTTEIARTYQPFSSQLSIYQSVLDILGAEDDVGEQMQ